MRVAIAQLNFHIGNIKNNAEKILNSINQAKNKHADLIVFSELAICGYPPHDLLENDEFVYNCIEEINHIAKQCNDIAVIIGGPSINNENGKKLYNSAYFIEDAKIKFIQNKALLPNYDVFQEYRYFEPSRLINTIDFKGNKIAIAICEDLWDEYIQPEYKFNNKLLYKFSTTEMLQKLAPDIVINIAASPFSINQAQKRKKILKEKAQKLNCDIIYVNQIGANTDLIFDGGSMYLNSKGQIIDELHEFEEEIKYIELNSNNSKPLNELDSLEKIQKALVLGIKDYFIKSGFNKAIIGLSGGIDSALTLVLACQALGNKNVKAILMPSEYSSSHSVDDAVKLAENLDCEYEIVKINTVVDAFTKTLNPFFRGTEANITEENIQARIRGMILMAFSNKFGYIVLNTSNKSELAVGYGTLYGDMCGGLSVIGDLYKTNVFKLSNFINRVKEIIPNNTIIKEPSAELRPNQKDSDSLPEYELLDAILENYIENKKGPKELINLGFERETIQKVIKLVNNAEYKRKQAPPILRISDKAFGEGRKIPIVAKY